MDDRAAYLGLDTEAGRGKSGVKAEFNNTLHLSFVLSGGFAAARQSSAGGGSYSKVPADAGEALASSKALAPRTKLLFGIIGGVVSIGAIIALAVTLTLPVPQSAPPSESCSYAG